MNPRALQAAGTAAIALLGYAVQAQAAEPPINTLRNSSLFATRTDTAISGYDTVAYFTEGKPVKGQDRFVTDWMGAKWKFASQDHLERFKAEPARYAPQYGGYCAYGVAQGYLVKVDPEQWTIREGKLYLNYDAGVQGRWVQDPAGYIKDADAKFPVLLSKP